VGNVYSKNPEKAVLAQSLKVYWLFFGDMQESHIVHEYSVSKAVGYEGINQQKAMSPLIVPFFVLFPFLSFLPSLFNVFVVAVLIFPFHLLRCFDLVSFDNEVIGSAPMTSHYDGIWTLE
jgi:hypothetical protein